MVTGKVRAYTKDVVGNVHYVDFGRHGEFWGSDNTTKRDDDFLKFPALTPGQIGYLRSNRYASTVVNLLLGASSEDNSYSLAYLARRLKRAGNVRKLYVAFQELRNIGIVEYPVIRRFLRSEIRIRITENFRMGGAKHNTLSDLLEGNISQSAQR